ncbi:MAG: GAF domain-containing protein, partial [Candidatus Marsarchaeota archaeon]|nr:GAF domain-containing protein [Candidatus Marsarchaeota archaeon]
MTGVRGRVVAEREIEAELRRRTEELETVFELSKTLTSALHLDALIEDTIAKLVSVIEPADTAALLLYDEKTNLLRIEASIGFEWGPFSKIFLNPGEAISGKVFESGEPLLCITPEDIRATMANLRPQNQKLFAEATAGFGHPQCAICAPLVARDQKVGVLLLENIRNPGSFNHADLSFVRALADLIAIAIDKAKLHREAEQVRVLEEANRLKSELISTLSHEMRTPLASIKGYATALLME